MPELETLFVRIEADLSALGSGEMRRTLPPVKMADTKTSFRRRGQEGECV